MREATARRDYLRAVVNAGLKFGGYVETDLSLVLNSQGRNTGELWVVGKEGGKPLLVMNAAANNAVSEAPKPIMAPLSVPLSPVFFVPADRRALVHKYQEALSGTRVDLKPLPGESIFLTAP